MTQPVKMQEATELARKALAQQKLRLEQAADRAAAQERREVGELICRARRNARYRRRRGQDSVELVVR